MSMEKLTNIFRSVFENDSLDLTPTLSANDVENWDSFNHLNLVINLEEAFGITFTTGDITGMRHVGDLVDLLVEKGHKISWP